jgi:uncharacterized protein (DUF2267 family)
LISVNFPQVFAHYPSTPLEFDGAGEPRRAAREVMMTSSQLHGVDHAIHSLHEWVNELRDLTGFEDDRRVYRLSRATLRALRDWLDVNEAAQLGAQLPLFIRRIYYEGWRPAATPVSERRKEDFFARVEEAFKPDPIDGPEEVITCVFRLLSRRISGGEIEDVRLKLPGELGELWPEEG